MLIDLLVQTLQYRESNFLFALPLKIWKNNPQKQDASAELQKCSALPKSPNLHKNKVIKFISVLILLKIYNFANALNIKVNVVMKL